jgi:hypothetical protein
MIELMVVYFPPNAVPGTALDSAGLTLNRSMLIPGMSIKWRFGCEHKAFLMLGAVFDRTLHILDFLLLSLRLNMFPVVFRCTQNNAKLVACLDRT